MNGSVRKLHAVVAAVLVLVWVPVTFHCTLENLPGLDFLNCCQDEKGCHGEEDCQADACVVVESGAYKIEDNQLTVTAPSLFANALLAIAGTETLVSTPEPQVSTELLGEFSSSWHFVLRAASPPRAPSRCS